MHSDHHQLTRQAEPVPVAFPAMIATMLASQATSRTATAQIHYDVTCRIARSPEQAIATLMQAHAGWRAAAGVLEGSFHPRVAALVGANSL